MKKKTNTSLITTNLKPNIILDKKLLFNFYNVYILSLQKTGMHFFGITMHCKNSIIETANFLNLSPQESMNKIIKDRCLLFKELEFIDFSFTTIEASEREDFYRAHIVLGIRSVDSNINSFHIYLLQFFNEYFFYEDFHIDPLHNFIDIKKWFCYMSKNLHVNDKLGINNFYLYTYSKLNMESHYLFLDHIQYHQEQFPDSDEFLLLQAFFKMNSLEQGNYSEIPGFNFKDKNTLKIFFYINLFMSLKNMFLYNNKLYQKNPDTKFSYKYIGKPASILNFNLPNFFISKFKSLSKEILLDLFMIDIKNLTNLLTKHNYFFKEAKIDFNVIEFLDGIYLMNSDTFIPLHFLENCDIITTRFYPEKYTNILKKSKPKKWLKILEKKLNQDKIANFCISYAQYFYTTDNLEKNKLTKQNPLFIKKIQLPEKILLKKLLLDLWGVENVLLISNDLNLQVETLNQNTQLIICEEFQYSNSNHTKLLNLIENLYSPINSNNKLPLIIFENDTSENEILINENIFKNNLEIYNFNTTIDLSSIKSKYSVENDSKIILYCNRLYIKHCNSNKYKRNKTIIIKNFLNSIRQKL
jgi:hypothetical protein